MQAKINLDYLEDKSWENFVETLSPDNPEKASYLRQIREANDTNEELLACKIKTAKVRAGQDNFIIKPTIDFYMNNPKCFGYGEWTKSINSFKTAEEAKDAILDYEIPDIDHIELGWGMGRSHSVIDSCNREWHGKVEDEINECKILQNESSL